MELLGVEARRGTDVHLIVPTGARCFSTYSAMVRTEEIINFGCH